MFPTNQFSYNVPLSKATRNHELIIAHNENPTRTRKSKRNSAKLDFTELREASKPKKDGISSDFAKFRMQDEI